MSVGMALVRGLPHDARGLVGRRLSLSPIKSPCGRRGRGVGSGLTPPLLRLTLSPSLPCGGAASGRRIGCGPPGILAAAWALVSSIEASDRTWKPQISSSLAGRHSRAPHRPGDPEGSSIKVEGGPRAPRRRATPRPGGQDPVGRRRGRTDCPLCQTRMVMVAGTRIFARALDQEATTVLGGPVIAEPNGRAAAHSTMLPAVSAARRAGRASLCMPEAQARGRAVASSDGIRHPAMDRLGGP